MAFFQDIVRDLAREKIDAAIKDAVNSANQGGGWLAKRRIRRGLRVDLSGIKDENFNTYLRNAFSLQLSKSLVWEIRGVGFAEWTYLPDEMFIDLVERHARAILSSHDTFEAMNNLAQYTIISHIRENSRAMAHRFGRYIEGNGITLHVLGVDNSAFYSPTRCAFVFLSSPTVPSKREKTLKFEEYRNRMGEATGASKTAIINRMEDDMERVGWSPS